MVTMMITAGLHMAFHRVHSAFLLYTDRYTGRYLQSNQVSVSAFMYTGGVLC